MRLQTPLQAQPPNPQSTPPLREAPASCLVPKRITADGGELESCVRPAAHSFQGPPSKHRERFLEGQTPEEVKTVIQGLSLPAQTLERANLTHREERRKVYRYKVALPLRFRAQTSSEGTDWISAETRDVSAWGVYFLTGQSVARGTRLVVALHVPRGASRDGDLVFRVRVRVVRSDDARQEGTHLAGIAAEIEHFCA